MVLGLLVDVPELRVPVRVLVPLQRLGVALQAEAILAQQAADRRRRHRMPLPGQLASQMPQRLGRPPQRRFSGRRARPAPPAPAGQVPDRRSSTAALLRPPPARRTRPSGNGSSRCSSSKTPARTVVSLTPATRATARTPPWPSSRASVASSNRRCRSFRCGISTSNLSDSCSRASAVMLIPPHQTTNTKTTTYFFTVPSAHQPGQNHPRRPAAGLGHAARPRLVLIRTVGPPPVS